MIRTLQGLVLAVFMIGLFGVPKTSFAQMEKSGRDGFVSDASFWIGTFPNGEEDSTTDARLEAAEKFLSTLSPDVRSKINLSLKARTRRQWTNLPARRDADGVRIGDLSKDQVSKLCTLIRATTSQAGFEKIRSIMIADDQLLRGGRPRQGFGTVDFSIVIFGKPKKGSPWSLQIDGHHMGINFSMHGDSVCLTPSFIGTQPKSFKIGNQTYSPFQSETKDAFALVSSLTNDQKREAVISNRRLRIKTGPGNDGFFPDSKGVSCNAFSDDQKKKLAKVIQAWVGILPKSIAEKRMKQILSETDRMKFSWAGKLTAGSDVSYTIQSPSLIIEYACQSLGGEPTNHLHSMIRNPKNEYAGQLDK